MRLSRCAASQALFLVVVEDPSGGPVNACDFGRNPCLFPVDGHFENDSGGVGRVSVAHGHAGFERPAPVGDGLAVCPLPLRGFGETSQLTLLRETRKFFRCIPLRLRRVEPERGDVVAGEEGDTFGGELLER